MIESQSLTDRKKHKYNGEKCGAYLPKNFEDQSAWSKQSSVTNGLFPFTKFAVFTFNYLTFEYEALNIKTAFPNL